MPYLHPNVLYFSFLVLTPNTKFFQNTNEAKRPVLEYDPAV